MKINYINKENIKKLTALVLAGNIVFSSLLLTGCKKKNQGIDTTDETKYRYSSWVKDAKIGEWYGIVYASSYNGSDSEMLDGVKFELRDEEENIVDSWTSNSKEAHILKGLDKGTYTLIETETPDGYYLTDTKNTWTINSDSGWNEEVFNISHVTKKDYTTSVQNILNTGTKENIEGRYFVLKLNNNSDTRSNNVKTNDNKILPKYILLRGTQAETYMGLENSSSIQYEFTDVCDENTLPPFNDTDVSLCCNSGGGYDITIWKSYCGATGQIRSTSLNIVPLEDLSQDEYKELTTELQEHPKMLEKLNEYSSTSTTEKAKVLTKNN